MASLIHSDFGFGSSSFPFLWTQSTFKTVCHVCFFHSKACFNIKSIALSTKSWVGWHFSIKRCFNVFRWPTSWSSSPVRLWTSNLQHLDCLSCVLLLMCASFTTRLALILRAFLYEKCLLCVCGGGWHFFMKTCFNICLWATSLRIWKTKIIWLGN